MLDFDDISKQWDEHSGKLLLIMRAHGAVAEEAVQEAFLALATQVELPESPLPWVVRVARNYVFQQYRSESRRTKRHQARQATESWLQSDECGRAVDAEEATEALRELPADMSEIVMMHLWGELSFSDIANAVSASRSSVHRKYQAAMALLRQKFSCSEKRV